MKKIVNIFNKNKEIDMETKEEMMAMDVNTFVKPKKDLRKVAVKGVLYGIGAIAGMAIGAVIWSIAAAKETGSDGETTDEEIEVIDTEATETPVCEEEDFTEVE